MIIMSKSEEACTGLLKIFGDIPELYEQNFEIVNRCDKETQDLLHEIELSENQSTAGAYRLYKALRDVRRERRRAKEENELLQPLVDALKQQETFRLKLYKVHDRIKELARQQSERTYTPRVREDLTIGQEQDTDDKAVGE
jgi:hypothetical protein